MRFIRDMELQPASLLELSARVVRLHSLDYRDQGVPASLAQYLDTGHQCVNPACDGVYFSHRVEHIKFRHPPSNMLRALKTTFIYESKQL